MPDSRLYGIRRSTLRSSWIRSRGKARGRNRKSASPSTLCRGWAKPSPDTGKEPPEDPLQGVCLLCYYFIIMQNTKNTIHKVSIEIYRGKNPRLIIADFIDDFNKATSEEKVKMVEKPPISLPKEHLTVYLAAVTDQLCHENKLETPEWAKKLSLKEPHFYGGSKLKMILLKESPVAFRKRNLFVSSSVMLRV